MRVWESDRAFDLESCVAALGTFDGLHKGHQALICRAVELSRELNTACVVYTFDRHPLSVLCPERAPEQLIPRAELIPKLAAMGVDGVLFQPFTREYAAIEPAAYLEELVARLHVKGVVAGFNYSFGAFGRGDAALIRAMAEKLGYRAEIVEAVRDGGDVVSSTLIRSLRSSGDDARARRLLSLGDER